MVKPEHSFTHLQEKFRPDVKDEEWICLLGKPTAREIAQTSATFTGSLTAIDLGQKTLKAKATFATKKFSLGDDCAIVVNGKPDGKLTDLRPGENLAFSYDDVNGVNIVNRIAPAGTESATQTTAGQSLPQ
ncbi:MAG: hypothetical protein ABSB84_01420 [Verrucomicrobiota bacterium]